MQRWMVGDAIMGILRQESLTQASSFADPRTVAVDKTFSSILLTPAHQVHPRTSFSLVLFVYRPADPVL